MGESELFDARTVQCRGGFDKSGKLESKLEGPVDALLLVMKDETVKVRCPYYDAYYEGKTGGTCRAYGSAQGVECPYRVRNTN